MTAVSEGDSHRNSVAYRLDRIGSVGVAWLDETDLEWLLALARGHQATLEQIASAETQYSTTRNVRAMARERLREAEGE